MSRKKTMKKVRKALLGYDLVELPRSLERADLVDGYVVAIGTRGPSGTWIGMQSGSRACTGIGCPMSSASTSAGATRPRSPVSRAHLPAEFAGGLTDPTDLLPAAGLVVIVDVGLC